MEVFDRNTQDEVADILRRIKGEKTWKDSFFEPLNTVREEQEASRPGWQVVRLDKAKMALHLMLARLLLRSYPRALIAELQKAKEGLVRGLAMMTGAQVKAPTIISYLNYLVTIHSGVKIARTRERQIRLQAVATIGQLVKLKLWSHPERKWETVNTRHKPPKRKKKARK